MTTGVQFTVETARRILETVRCDESARGLFLGEPAPQEPGNTSAKIVVTDGTADADGNYPALIVIYDASTTSWQSYDVCVIRDPNGGTLTKDSYYDADFVGYTTANVPLFFTFRSGGTGGTGGASVSMLIVDTPLAYTDGFTNAHLYTGSAGTDFVLGAAVLTRSHNPDSGSGSLPLAAGLTYLGIDTGYKGPTSGKSLYHVSAPALCIFTVGTAQFIGIDAITLDDPNHNPADPGRTGYILTEASPTAGIMTLYVPEASLSGGGVFRNPGAVLGSLLPQAIGTIPDFANSAFVGNYAAQASWGYHILSGLGGISSGLNMSQRGGISAPTAPYVCLEAYYFDASLIQTWLDPVAAIRDSAGVIHYGQTETDILGGKFTGGYRTGQSPAAKQAVTGSRGGNAALASLLTALATLGLITNNTTA